MRALGSVSWVHTLGILRGAAEGNDTKYSHVLNDYERHAAPLLATGLVRRLDDDEQPDLDSFVNLTPAGRAFYYQHLTGLPATTQCRANLWNTLPEMRSALTALKDTCTPQDTAL